MNEVMGTIDSSDRGWAGPEERLNEPVKWRLHGHYFQLPLVDVPKLLKSSGFSLFPKWTVSAPLWGTAAPSPLLQAKGAPPKGQALMTGQSSYK